MTQVKDDACFFSYNKAHGCSMVVNGMTCDERTARKLASKF